MADSHSCEDGDKLSLLAHVEHVDESIISSSSSNSRTNASTSKNPSVFGLLNIVCGPTSLVQWKLDPSNGGGQKLPSPSLSSSTSTLDVDDVAGRINRPAVSPSSKTLLLVSTVVVATATLLTVLFPNVIVQSINDQSDAYCAIFFVSFACCLPMAFAVLVAQFFSMPDRLSIWPPTTVISLGRMVKLAAYYGLSGLAIFYGRDRFRVLCHLQDPLSAAVLPLAVICHLFVSARLDSVRKLACIAVAIIGLFICVDYQIWDEFSCPGRVFATLNGDGMLWTTDEHVVWTGVYLIGLAVLVLFYTLLENSLRENNQKVEYVVSTIQMSTTVVEKSSLSFVSTLVLCTWIQFFSWMTVAVLFWTDLFSFLGRPVASMASSSFHEMMLYGTACFLGIGGDDCPRTACLVWTFVVLSSILFVALVYLIVISSSVVHSFALMTLALPLSTLWWSVFRIGADGLHWSPHLSVETLFTLVGLPVMIAGLLLYSYYGNRPTNEPKHQRQQQQPAHGAHLMHKLNV